MLCDLNRFHPSVEQIHRCTERDFPTVQINTSDIYSLIASSNRIRPDKIILKSMTANANYAEAALWDTAIKFSLQSRAMTSPDHLDRVRQIWRVHLSLPALAGPDFLNMRRVIVSYSQPIRFARFDGKSVVVYHLHGETGWSMVCTNGKQNS